MAINVSEAVSQLIQDRGMSEDLAFRTIEQMLLAAYKGNFGTVDNAVIRFGDDGSVSMYARRKVVEYVHDPIYEIDIEEAQQLNHEATEGDELLIELDPKNFSRNSIHAAKRTAAQSLRDIQKDTLYSEYKDRVGEIIVGYYQRERDGTIYVDLGRTEGIFPKEFQSPIESYHVGDRIRSLIYKVQKGDSGLQIILSRTHNEFIRAIFELEVPEIYDRIVEIHKIVRKPGYRTKIAVYSNREDIDPVGACVGMRGSRIQSIIKELEGEKIDVLRYDPDPRHFIKNALAPAAVQEVFILNEAKHDALAIVSEEQFFPAIGKQGLNVRLANRLVDWNIDVKTEKDFKEKGIVSELTKAATDLFSDAVEEDGHEELPDEIEHIAELPGVDPAVVSLLLEAGIDYIEDFINLSDKDRLQFETINAEQWEHLNAIVEKYVEIVEEESEEIVEEEAEFEEEDEEEVLECPECGALLTIDMLRCPSCGVGLSFETSSKD
ncbi:MAG: transcription termination factor NusA [Treponema sp.]|jgi:N utilization substance protein A|nr:transcription termination factor NusA [Treponema sp.]